MRQVFVLLFTIATLHLSAQNAAEIDSMEQTLPTAEGEARLELLNALTVYYAPRDPDKAIEHARVGSALSKQLHDQKMEARFLKRIGILHRRWADYDSAEYYYNASLELAMVIQDSSLICENTNNLGYLFKSKGEVDKAISYYEKALALHEEYKDTAGAAIVLVNLGNIYRVQAKEGEAMGNYMKALKIYEDQDDQRGIARVYNNLNLLFREFNKYDDALHYAEMALEINTELGDKRGMAISYNNIGIIYDIKKETGKAIEMFTKAYTITNELGLKSFTLSVVGNMGQAYWTMKDYDNATFYFEQSLELSKAIDYVEGLVSNYNNIGMALQAQGKYEKAVRYFEKSLELNTESIFSGYAAQSHQLLGDSYAAMRNFELSSQHRELSDSIDKLSQTEEQRLIVEDMKTKYETEKKEVALKLMISEWSASQIENALIASEGSRKTTMIWAIGGGAVLLLVSLLVAVFAYAGKRKTNVLLEAKNEEIEKQRNDVMKLNVTKDKLLSIVAHDLKNPFGILQSMTRMLVEKYDTLKEEQKKEIVQTVYKSFNSTYDLVENLLQWSRAQTKGLEANPEKIDLGGMVDKNFTLVKLLAAKKNIDLKMDIEPNLSVVADANMINTVCRNLLTNAIKFTGDNGQITVKAQARNQEVEIVVEDNGIGVKQEDISKLFKIETNAAKIGSSPEKGTGLGLVLCHDFVTANGGEISMESEIGKGSAVKFTLKKAS